ncbi:MAG: hypothetical protein CL944_00445 [Candidatus Diapherotrites archaeon]|uniref:Uncharacterized protein n=1 Tax=Candidatus Iainarchaeum sp. TaxID=3101447 RepID=A0A2D6LP16_9ARCH|nr:hypothetical protein [Candidatus Diapherotrites archaeon]|tara:strand:+ start:8250 stop:8783 length:534 start_codon:yes stop_codon:yes gene_type:complete
MKFKNIGIVLIGLLFISGCVTFNGKSNSNESILFVCGNGVCESNEDDLSCPDDCDPNQICGDYNCRGTENEENCPVDCLLDCAGGGCGAEEVCGNDICEIEETGETCPGDCASPDPDTEDNSCNVRANCPTRQDCQAGRCVEVECIFNSHCDFGEECNSSRRCQPCPTGALGVAACR